MDLKNLFLSESTLREHYDALKYRRNEYMAVQFILISKKIELTLGAKSRCLAAAFSLHDREFSDFLLAMPEHYHVAEVLKALYLLDAPRQARLIGKKLSRLENQGCKKKKKMGQMKSTMNDLGREEVPQGSCSGAVARYIRRWVKTIPADRLEYFALNMPKKTWQKLADLVHFNPSDFQVDWFLPFVYGETAAIAKVDAKQKEKNDKENNNVDNNDDKDKNQNKDEIDNGDQTGELAVAFGNVDNLSATDVLDKIKSLHPPYSFLRRSIKDKMNKEAYVAVAEYENLQTVLWYWEEICEGASSYEEVNRIISRRLDDGEKPIGARASYGKLMERLMTFRSHNAPFADKIMNIAEERLHDLSIDLEPPIAVFGDASYSMEIAIKTANIFSSMLTVLTNAELSFFASEYIETPFHPKSARDVLKLTEQVHVRGCTAPAACLWPYYQNKKKVKTFFIVTDEMENTPYRSFRFAPLFEKYQKEVYPATLVFISFLRPGIPGEMVTQLRKKDIDFLQFRLDGNRPDLTKLDSLLSLLETEGSTFDTHVQSMAEMIEKEGIRAGMEHLGLISKS